MNRYQYLDENKEHMHTLDGKPLYGTSSVTKIVNKPLTWWAAGKALEPFGWMNPALKNAAGRRVGTVSNEEQIKHAQPFFQKIVGMTGFEYIELLQTAYRNHDSSKMDAAVKGTDRHATLERYVKYCISSNEGKPIKLISFKYHEGIEQFIVWAESNIKKFLWSEANCYSEKLWTGGIADVGWLDDTDRIIAGDFKSSKEAYFEQFIQIAGYDIALTENGGLDKDGNVQFTLPGEIKGYCVIPFGAPKLTPNFQYDVEAYREGFKSALTLTKLQSDFNF